MKIMNILLLCFYILFCFSINITFSQKSNPLSIKKILKLIEVRTPEVRIVKYLEEFGVDFVVDEKVLSQLIDAGATEQIIEAIRKFMKEPPDIKTGGIFIESIPSGAKVYIDGKLMDGETPITIKYLPPGRKTLKVGGIANHDYYNSEITIIEDSLVSVNTKLPRLYTVLITTIPTGAKVFYVSKEGKQKYLGETKPNETLGIKDIYPGTYTFKANKAGYKMLTREIFLNSDRRLTLQLNKATGIVVVKTDPLNSDIFLNDSYEGMSPLEIEAEPGEYTISAHKKDYIPEKITIEIVPEYKKQLDITLRKSPKKAIIKGSIGLVSVGLATLGYYYDNRLQKSYDKYTQELSNDPKTHDDNWEECKRNKILRNVMYSCSGGVFFVLMISLRF